MKTRTVICLSLICMLFTTSCTSMRTVDGPAVDRLRVGEVTDVHHSDGRVSRIVIEEVRETDIVGTLVGTSNGISIPRSEIASFEVERIDIVKSAAAGVGGTALAVFTVYFVAFLSLLAMY